MTYIIPTYAHPLVQELYTCLNCRQQNITTVAVRLGLDVEELCSRDWMLNPDIKTLEAMFHALEFDLVVVAGRRPPTVAFLSTYKEPYNDNLQHHSKILVEDIHA